MRPHFLAGLLSLLIVALLFLSPVAAIIPILMGGISISIALSAIYIAIVKLGNGNITFLTPTLTILLVLGWPEFRVSFVLSQRDCGKGYGQAKK